MDNNVSNQNINLEKDEIYLKNVAKLGRSAKNVYVVDNVLSDKEHKELSDFINNSDQGFWVKEPWSTERIGRESIPNNNLELLKKIFEVAHLKCKNHYDIEINDVFRGEYGLLKWSKGSKMNPHIDTDYHNHQHIVCIYYINDDYEGGEIVFPDYNINIKPKSNSLIMFPGNENYVHGVLEILKGFRYTFPIRFEFAGSTFLGPAVINRKV